uniref:Arrestin C-terminal-like domain-containing protein n=1 Tax=Palpitomonas bilix TaxID=652834 RepID=A0A7S3CYD7_9EUKA|mmetsp:Transcript_1469/g.2872  ORF Transcript_1469/g.2872 Transcript_1469/m.2872 type:complete len:426 (+) Transcript_1469:123-1400(+)
MALSIELRLHNINNLNGYFEVYTGTTISGEVVVRNPTPLKARGVRIKIVGHEYVHWTEQRTEGDGENRRTYTEHISDGVTFFEERQTVWQRSSSSERLQPGEYAWPFQMILPANLPPSFEMFGSVDAFVRYRFSAYIDLPWRFDKALEIFLIVRQYVPEQFIASSFSSNLQLQNRKTIGCLCCKAGDLQASIQLPSGAICPGFQIAASAVVDNFSTREINNSALCLERRVHCCTRWGRSRREHRRVVEVSYQDFCTPPRKEGDDRVLRMEFPEHVWQSFQSALIHVNYHLDFRVRPKRSLDLRLAAPIFVLPPAARPLLDAVTSGGVSSRVQAHPNSAAIPDAVPVDPSVAERGAQSGYSASAPTAAAAHVSNGPQPAQFSFRFQPPAEGTAAAVPSAPVLKGEVRWEVDEADVGRLLFVLCPSI